MYMELQIPVTLHRSYKLRRSGIVTRRNYKPQRLDVQGMGVVSSPIR